jgi:hypothetical protein
MATLRTQYLKFLKENSNSNFTYDDWFEYVYKENINKISISKLKINKIITHLNNLSSDNINISNIGTEIGIAIGRLTKKDIDNFIEGFKNGNDEAKS